MSDGVELEIQCLPLGPIGTNCYVVCRAGADAGIIIDPGAQPELVLEHARSTGFHISDIVITHCHWDHIGAVAAIARATGAPVWMSDVEAPALETPKQFAFPGMPEVEACEVTHRLQGDETLELAGMRFDVLPVPGHSPGHLAFVAPASTTAGGDAVPPICFSGDVLFRGSVGRTDLPYADTEQLNDSLRLMVERLDPSTVILSGHGEPTQLGQELATNPFLLAL